MPTKINEWCKFGATCKRRETCRYLHPNYEYDNMLNYFSNEPDYNSAQWPIGSYDNSQFEYESQQACLKLLPCFPPIVHHDNFDPNGQQFYFYDIGSQYCQQPGVLSISSKPWEKPYTNRKDNIPEITKQHQSLLIEQQRLLEDMDDDDDMKLQTEGNLQELKDQFEIFQQTIFNLSTINPLTLEDANYHLNRLKREIERFKARLPIYARRQQLIDTIKSNRVIILKADTGSGKSSQLIQYLADAGFADYGQIVCTQPRRLAARELASRVAKEFGCQVGEEVGCHVGACRPKVSSRTRIRFVTDAVLLNEYQMDPMLYAYTLVIIDEAHERHVDTDLLFGAMKLCLSRRSDIKLIVMSATLDDKLLSKYYKDACLIEVPGRAFPIKDIYAMEDAENHVDEAVNKVLEIHTSGIPGDILVFLTGQDEINQAIDKVTSKIDSSESVLVLPLHGKLNEDEMQAVFMTKNSKKQRKIIFSTNVAETSITIDGIQHVIDSGMVKEVMWDTRRRIRVLKIGYTTQSSIKQRRGRAGRTSAGTCYHLYTYDTYQSLEVCSRAEILCIQPSIAVLKLKHLDIVEDITKFDWLESPSNNSLQETVKSLTWLGAINSKTGKLTGLGRRMAKLGLEPMFSVMILTGQKLNCLSHVLALVGMLSVVQNIWWRGENDQSKHTSDEIRASFARDTGIGGDFIVLLRIFLEWHASGERRDRRKAWCLKHMIRWKSMTMANSLVRELVYQIDPKFQVHLTELNDELIKQIVHCICAGFFQNLAISNGPIRAGYQLATGTTDTVAHIHRSSVITFAQQPPKFILYHEIININETNYLTVMCPVELDWLDKSWLDSLPCSPSQCAFDNYTFVNLGPALLLALVGRKCKKIPQLEEQLHVLFEVDRAQSKLTIWGHPDKLSNAQQCLHQILNRERDKLRNELQDFQIIGSTRILLGAGAEPRLALVEDEYIKIFLKNLPKNITEEQIQQKCELYGQVRNVTTIRTNYNNSSASVTYATCNDARLAATQLSCEKWDDYQIYATPSYTRTSVNTNRQNYKLKAQWFMTESECNGRVVFNKRQRAQQAYELFTNRCHFRCQFEINPINPMVKCSWPLKPYHGHAIVNFPTVEQAQEYPSFQRESVFIEPYQYDGRVVAYVQFTDEQEMRAAVDDINKIQPLIGAGILRLSVQEQRQINLRKKTNENKQDEFRVKLYQLPSHIDERSLIRELNQYNINDSITYTIVFRKKLSADYFLDRSKIMTEDNRKAFINLKSLFTSRHLFLSEPNIEIRSPTEDGRAVAYIHFNDPRDIMTAINMCDSLDNSTMSNIGLNKLHFVPIIVHKIIVNQALAQAINNKIEQTMNTIQTSSNFTNIMVFKKIVTKDDKANVLISIRGTNIQQLYKARILFDNLLKGLEFQLYNHSWVTVLFDAAGLYFLQDLQKRTGTYIWWNWKSTLLRIFGEDSACQDAHRQIDTFIQTTLSQSEHSISIPIPKDCIRQCIQNSSVLRELDTKKTKIVINMIKCLISVSGDREAVIECEQKVKQFLDKFTCMSNHSNGVTPENIIINMKNICSICNCDFDSPYTLEQCGHTFCRSCLSAYFDAYFDVTLSFEAFKLSCPFYQCNEICLIRDIVSVIGFERMARLAMIAFQVYIRRPDNDLVQCMGIDCNQV
ncbi:unnamed protein product [Rotaria sordida]|uniref:RNA helicase n=1 Tax=Rotaria sordida TaxID=392033 RepID=A0A818KXR5_9BILA|nr:unnamed protein product [Rotaria sordida]